MRARARRDDLRPGLRHRRLPARRARLHRPSTTPTLDQGPEAASQGTALRGWEIVDGTARAVRDEPAPARHRIRRRDVPIPISDDSLAADPGERFDVVLTNPPFGKKSQRH